MDIAIASQLQREAAVLANLLQHVVEETQPGMHLRLGHPIQVDVDGDAGFLGVAYHRGRARRIQQLVRQRRPAEAERPHAEAAHTEVRGKLQVGLAITRHGRCRAAPAVVGKVVPQHADARLARVLALVREAAVDQHFAKADALRGEDAQQQFVRPGEMRFRETVGAQSILVCHHHQLVASHNETLQRGDHARQQRQLFIAVDLLVGRLLDQAAVTIDEEDLAAHVRLHEATSSV